MESQPHEPRLSFVPEITLSGNKRLNKLSTARLILQSRYKAGLVDYIDSDFYAAMAALRYNGTLDDARALREIAPLVDDEEGLIHEGIQRDARAIEERNRFMMSGLLMRDFVHSSDQFDEVYFQHQIDDRQRAFADFFNFIMEGRASTARDEIGGVTLPLVSSNGFDGVMLQRMREHFRLKKRPDKIAEKAKGRLGKRVRRRVHLAMNHGYYASTDKLLLNLAHELHGWIEHKHGGLYMAPWGSLHSHGNRMVDFSPGEPFDYKNPI